MPLTKKNYDVEISPRAYQRMVGYASRYANDQLDMKRWREVYGILVGFIRDGREVVVEDAIPMLVGGRAGVQFENKQYVDAAMIDEELYERGLQDPSRSHHFFCGWWHTHPGFSFFYSEVDTLTHLGYQWANPRAIGIIFDHTERSSFDPGIEVLRLKNIEDGLMADYEFVNFDLKDHERFILKGEEIEQRLRASASKLRGILKSVRDLKKKGFAQLQRNYGLLLVPKYLSKQDKEDLAGGDDEGLWEWNEEILAAKYRIPKFRKRVENALSREEARRKRVKTLESIDASLGRVRARWDELWREYWNQLRHVAPFYWFLDTDERKTIELVHDRLVEYYQVLDGLVTRVKFGLAAASRSR
ncbi:MAG: hypothetical protein ACTSU5_07245 [Promethearchaeota archaeon]